MIARLIQANRRLAGAMLALSLTGLGGLFWVDGRIEALSSRVRPSAAEEMRRFHAQLHIDAEVERALATLTEDTEADRALVYLAHNGRTDLSGAIPFLYLSVSHVHLRPGLSWEERWSRPVPMSVFSPLLRRMFRDGAEVPRCVRRDRGDADMGEVARARMADRGTELAYLCALIGPGGVVGLLSVEALRRDMPRRPSDEAIFEQLTQAARRIHDALTARR